MNRKIMKHLLWKDARTLGPLAIAIPVLVLLFFGALGLLDNDINLDGTSRLSGGYTIWFLLPILIAYGAPAVLVGGEEESGSLAWLRTLPASWSSISQSKLLVTTVCLGIAWLISTLCFLGYWESIPERMLRSVRAGAAPEPFWLHFVGNIWLSLVLMLSSFITAYLLRSPITALIAVVPVMGAAVGGTAGLTFFLAPVEAANRLPGAPPPAATVAVFCLVGLVVLLILLVMHQLAARQRLEKPASRMAERKSAMPSREAFRPPPTASEFNWYGSAIAHGRPPQWFALLWQNMRQMGWHFWCLVTIGVFGAFSMLARGSSIELVGGLGLLAGLCLGSLPFYGDSVRNRCRFFADRGVSPTMVWWTRIAPTALALLLLSLMAWGCASLSVGHVIPLHESLNVLAIVFAVFSLAQLTSQWSPRPVLTFFAAPVFCCFAGFALASLFNFYSWSVWVLAFSGLVLMFASWRLTPRWIRGETGKPYILRLLGYGAFALLLPYVLVLGGRWITTPAVDAQWRQQMLSMTFSASRNSSRDSSEDVMQLRDQAFGVSMLHLNSMMRPMPLNSLSTNELIDAIKNELADDQAIGGHVSVRQLHNLAALGSKDWQKYQDSLFGEYTQQLGFGFSSGVGETLSEQAKADEPPGYSDEEVEQLRENESEVRLLAARVLVKWSTTVREMALAGNASFSQVFGLAETADSQLEPLLSSFEDLYHNEPNEAEAELLELFGSLPDKTLVRQSRRISLIRDWQRYAQPTESSLQMGRRFAGLYSMAPSQRWLAVERIRSDRYLDKAMKLILSKWDSGQDFQSLEQTRELDELLQLAYFQGDNGTTSAGRSSLSLGQRIAFARRNDQSLARLRVQASQTKAK